MFAITTTLGLALLPVPLSPASASCPAPYLEGTEGLVMERGAAATIEGRSFVDGCQDSMNCSAGLGCGSCAPDGPPPTPMENVGLRLVQRLYAQFTSVVFGRTTQNSFPSGSASTSQDSSPV